LHCNTTKKWDIKFLKFGGASVKSAEAVRNVAKLIQLHKDQPLLVVVSAMGKTTNLLESLVEKFLGEESYEGELIQLKEFHRRIIEELIGAEKETFFEVENPIYRVGVLVGFRFEG
jgi:aspartate kinase